MLRQRSQARFQTSFRFAVLASATMALGAVAGDPESPSVTQEPTGSLGLATACAAALAGSPTLEGFSWEIRAGEARLLQAGLRPNPTLAVTVEDVLGTGDFKEGREAQTTVQLSQVIELGGKRTARRGVASAARDLATRDYEVARVEVLANTAEKFIELLAAQRELALSQETTAMAEAILSTVRQRIRAGNASPLEEPKALVALARRRIDEEHAEHELAVTRRRLAATWGSTTPSFTEAVGNLFALPSLPSYDALGRRVTGSPEITRWISTERLRIAELTLAQARRTPNLTAGGGFRRLEGPDDEAFVFQLSMPLPLFDRKQGDVAEARARQTRTAAEKRTAEIRLTTVLYALHQELLHGQIALESLRATVVPQAQAALALSETGFRQGRFSHLDLLDAQRTLTEVKREQIETAASSQQLLLSIERLIGQPLHDDSPYQD